MPKDTKNKLIKKETPGVADFVKNPIQIKNFQNKEKVSEKVLQRLILEDISLFLENWVMDLRLYNIKYKCYVVVELKVTELKRNIQVKL